MKRRFAIGGAIVAATLLSACGGNEAERRANVERQRENSPLAEVEQRESIFDIFRRGDSSREINVNKYLWSASLDVLSFLPLEAVDPFSGVISTGWGRVPGSSGVYRSTVYVSGPALDARSLRVAVFRQSGGRALAVSDEVAEQIENSILTRARELSIAAERR